MQFQQESSIYGECGSLAVLHKLVLVKSLK